MRARRIRATAVAAIAGLTLAAAACGDDSNDSAATTAAERAEPIPDGASGLHQIVVTVQ